eukprot:jgi/Mesen1/9643/ME000067S09031
MRDLGFRTYPRLISPALTCDLLPSSAAKKMAGKRAPLGPLDVAKQGSGTMVLFDETTGQVTGRADAERALQEVQADATQRRAAPERAHAPRQAAAATKSVAAKEEAVVAPQDVAEALKAVAAKAMAAAMAVAEADCADCPS